MFGWLANLIVKTPVQGTCSCCEGRKKQLQKMQSVIIGDELNAALLPDEERADQCRCTHEQGEAEEQAERNDHHDDFHTSCSGGCQRR